MRKKILAAIVAALMLSLCVPFFSGCSASVNYVLSDDGEYYIASCSGSRSSLSGELFIESTYNGLPVKEIAKNGFRRTSITKVVIPSSIEYIGKAAFGNCTSLTDVEFMGFSQVTEISQGLFGFCTKLEEITIPQSVSKIGDVAFIGCERLKSITLPDSVEEIGIETFELCSALTEISLPKGLKTIGAYAFYQAGLTEIIIPSSVVDRQVKVLDKEGNPKLDEDNNPVMQTVYGIGVGAFHTCLYLKKVAIMQPSDPQNAKNVLATLSAGVFGACSALEEIYLPSTITAIKGHVMNGSKFGVGHAFHHCTALTTVHFAGTAEQWSAITKENTSYSGNGQTFDNNAIINAKKYFESVYVPA